MTGSDPTWRGLGADNKWTTADNWADQVVPVSQTQGFADAREAAGLHVEVDIYDDAPHGFFNDASSAVATQAMGRVLKALAS